MNIICFILGLGVGIAFHLWRQNQLNQKLRGILDSVRENPDKVYELSLISLLRREIISVNKKCLDLESELETWKGLIEEAPLGYLGIDEENQLLWCNRHARELLLIDRWEPGQVRLLLELVRSYELDQLVQKTRQTQQPQTQEWQFYALSCDGDSKQRSLALKGFAFPLPLGEVAVFIENQQLILNANQQRERAFSDLTHELRTPLTAISAVAEVLQKRLKNPEKQWVEQMSQEIQRLIQLVEDWLDVTQLNQDPHQQLNYESTEIKALIFSSWEILQPLATPKEISLNYSGPEQLYLQADPSRLTQVFLNIFDNAIKYSPSQKAIFVELVILPDQILKINIIDSGPGFVDTDLPHVFQRLYRGDYSRSRISTKLGNKAAPVSNGGGLGLSIVQQIIQAHKGIIQANNHPTTGGAWLQITLPLQCEDFLKV